MANLISRSELREHIRKFNDVPEAVIDELNKNFKEQVEKNGSLNYSITSRIVDTDAQWKNLLKKLKYAGWVIEYIEDKDGDYIIVT